MSEGATVYVLRCADGSLYVGITRRTIDAAAGGDRGHGSRAPSGLSGPFARALDHAPRVGAASSTVSARSINLAR